MSEAFADPIVAAADGERHEQLVSADTCSRATRCTFRAFGVEVEFRANRRDLLTAARKRFPPGSRAVRADRVTHRYSLTEAGNGLESAAYLLDRDDDPVGRYRTRDEMLDVLENELDACVALNSPTRLFVHAGVVGWRGRAIVIPGRSFSGKTTLVRALVQMGATYYSDEFALLDESGLVHPYARPLGVRAGGAKQTKVTAAALGARIGHKPLPVGLVVATRYRAEARWRPRRLTTGQGVLALLADTVPARRDPRRAMEVLGKAVAAATIFKGVRGDADAVAAKILAAAEGKE